MNKKRYKKTIIFDKEMEDFVKENINKSINESLKEIE